MRPISFFPATHRVRIASRNEAVRAVHGVIKMTQSKIHDNIQSIATWPDDHVPLLMFVRLLPIPSRQSLPCAQAPKQTQSTSPASSCVLAAATVHPNASGSHLFVAGTAPGLAILSSRWLSLLLLYGFLLFLLLAGLGTTGLAFGLAL